jgi:hypothetical protein
MVTLADLNRPSVIPAKPVSIFLRPALDPGFRRGDAEDGEKPCQTVAATREAPGLC